MSYVLEPSTRLAGSVDCTCICYVLLYNLAITKRECGTDIFFVYAQLDRQEQIASRPCATGLLQHHQMLSEVGKLS